jgi:hypothetical protein
MAGVIKTERKTTVFNAYGSLLTEISLKNVTHCSPTSFRSQLLTTGRPDAQLSQDCTSNYDLTNNTQPIQYYKISEELVVIHLIKKFPAVVGIYIWQ